MSTIDQGGDIFRQGGDDDTPVKVDMEDLLADISYYRRKCLRVETILYRDPVERDDDAFIVRINPNSTGLDAEIHLEIKVTIDLLEATFRVPDLPLTPEAPAGCRIKHTIAILLVGEADFGDITREGEYDHFKKSLKEWLYGNKDLDKRVTRIEHQTADNVLGITAEDIIRYLDMRREGDCEPLTGISLPEGTDLRQKTPHLHSEIRSLRIHPTLLYGIGDGSGPQAAIDLLDLALPKLEYLLIDDSLFSEEGQAEDTVYPSLMGLPNLRFLDFQANTPLSTEGQEVGLAVLLCGLGAGVRMCQ